MCWTASTRKLSNGFILRAPLLGRYCHRPASVGTRATRFARSHSTKGRQDVGPSVLPPGSGLFPSDHYYPSSGLGLKRPDVQLWQPPRCVTVFVKSGWEPQRFCLDMRGLQEWLLAHRDPPGSSFISSSICSFS